MEQPNAFAGQSDYVMTPDDHNKKPSLFGKLKDRTKKAGSKIRSKVKKDNHDGTGVEHEDDEGAYSDEEESPISSPVGAASHDYTSSEPSRFSGHKSEAPVAGFGGLSLNEPAPPSSYKSYDEPSYSVPQSSPYNEPSSIDTQSKPYNEPSYTDTQSKPYNEPSYTDTQSKPYNEPSYTDTQSKPYNEPSYTDTQSKPFSEPSYDEPQSRSYDEPKSAYPESTPYPSQEPTLTDKASDATQGAKDTLYGGAGATAGALGLGAAKNEYDDKRDYDNKPLSEKVSDTTYDARSKVEEIGDRGYDRVTDSKDRVAGQTENTFGYPGSEPTAADKAAETKDAAASKAYDAKDAVESKAYDVNNASNDSETYTEKANKTAQAAKDSVAGTLGYGTATEGPSLVEKAKQTAGFDSTPTYGSEPTATEKAQWKADEAKDVTGSKAYEAKDAVQSKAADVNNATDDSQTYTQKASNAVQAAKDSAAEALGVNQSPSYTGTTQPTLAEKAKDTLGLNQPSHTPSSYTGIGQEPTYTQKAADAVTSAKDSAAATLGVNQSPSYTGTTQPTLAEKTKNALGLNQPSQTPSSYTGVGQEPTYTQKAADTAQSAKDSAAGAVDANRSPSYTGTTQPTLAEKAKDALGLNQSSQSPSSYTGIGQEPTLAEKAKDTLGLNKPSQTPSSYTGIGQEPTYTQKAADAVTSAKDSAAATLGVNQSPSYTGTTQPTLAEKTKDALGLNKPGPTVVDSAKDGLASTVDTTKAYATSAKDTAVDTATPKREDKALSEKITEALGGLPGRAQATAASATQSAKTPTTATTTTPGTVTDAHTTHVDEPASPGILGKLGGLFGYGAKAPEHHDPTLASTTPTTTTTTTQPPNL